MIINGTEIMLSEMSNEAIEKLIEEASNFLSAQKVKEQGKKWETVVSAITDYCKSCGDIEITCDETVYEYYLTSDCDFSEIGVFNLPFDC